MTMPPSRQSAYATAPLLDLFTILLRQFKRPLANVGVDLTPAVVDQVADLLANRRPLDDQATAVREGLRAVVTESEAWFGARGLTFETSLRTEMGNMPGWETTAEFLDLANEKSNAELRVAAASALLVALGDKRHTPTLRFLVENPELDDVSALLAERVLTYIADA
jgi:hypothetical protein